MYLITIQLEYNINHLQLCLCSYSNNPEMFKFRKWDMLEIYNRTSESIWTQACLRTHIKALLLVVQVDLQD